MISEFVSKNYIPVVAHELTHYEQILIQMKIRGNVGNPRYAYSKHEIGSEKFMVDYLSEPQEIGAFATQFVSTLNASFPNKTSNELMQMVRNNEIPTDISDAIEYYYVKVVNYMKRGEKEGNPLVKKFKKNVYMILDSQSKEKSK
jgi:adenine-specific DNA methylase